jgi:hypothetical protein
MLNQYLEIHRLMPVLVLARRDLSRNTPGE